MNDTQGRGYARIEAMRTGGRQPPPEDIPAPPDMSTPPPDPNHLIYTTLVVAGTAFLLPYNSFIMAVDYFQHHYPKSTIMFDMSTVYIATAFVAVIANNLLLEAFSYNTRITFGILVSLTTMIFVAVCNIGWDGFSNSVSYAVNLVALALVALGCTVQQASYYGFTSCLPPRYTQAVMAGESGAGFMVSLDRILTKYMFQEPKRNTFAFFLFSIFVLLWHSVSHHMMMKHPLTKYYLRLTQESRRRIVLEPAEDAGLMEPDGSESFGVLKLTTSPPPPDSGRLTSVDGETSAFSFANPLYSPTSSAPVLPTSPPVPLVTEHAPVSHRTSYKVEDVVFTRTERPTTWHSIKRALAARWMVALAIYPYMVAIGNTYFVTLSLYPGITSEIRSCRFDTWMPVIVMASFNLFDVVGKIAATWPYEWSRSQLLMGSGLRLLLVPLMLLCAAPRNSPHIKGDAYPILFSMILGLTNGVFGSIPMVLAPARVSREHREIAGNIMTLSYNVGLLSGSLVSYLLLDMLGAAPLDPCADTTIHLPALPTAPHPAIAVHNTTRLLFGAH